ncbi:SGNH family lipase [Actinomadura kijaniata]|uniref:Lysophospholipase L1-like esterase n=1 Tax=Actinomadura namibiensis TaxID=182080 RepID=A0A7W3QR42_ACTNM|nr:SGNH/GDSL hydrolase family protein [Actinomadura namibiensis]MBA8956354.1 lysophospholipase L1-like esterase [Actinomadura namibiensis]
MRLSPALPVAIAALAAALLPAPAAAAQVREYVAMGDSYSSGTGAGDYTDIACTRSRNAYPARWAAANAPGAFRFVACGGARIPDVQNAQLPALTSTTELVSISIGGNDSGFASTMISCRYFSTTACQNALRNAAVFVRTELPGRLDGLYTAIRTRAPRARVVVLGYPYLYREGGVCAGMNATKRELINDGSDQLNAVIADRARAAGFAFADARPAFAGHEICTADEWIDGGNVHPTAEGHAKGYLPAFAAATGG